MMTTLSSDGSNNCLASFDAFVEMHDALAAGGIENNAKGLGMDESWSHIKTEGLAQSVSAMVNEGRSMLM